MASQVLMTPIAALDRDFTLFVKQFQGDVSILRQKLGLQLLMGVVLKTPVDTGRARGNWQASHAAPKGGIVAIPEVKNLSGDTMAGAAAGQQAINSGISVITANTRPYETLFITNNIPYILVLDQGGFVPADPGPSKDKRKFRKGRVLVKSGYSIQAPKGMVDLTIEEIRSQFI